VSTERDTEECESRATRSPLAQASAPAVMIVRGFSRYIHEVVVRGWLLRKLCACLALTFLVAAAHPEKADVASRARPVEVSFPAASSQTSLRLTGFLYRPDGPGPVPGLILLHECAGITPVLHRWGETVRQWGYAALLVDSFAPRNERDLCFWSGGPTISTQYARMPDAYAAKRYLAAQAFIDKNRIGVMGWGHGGWAVLFAVDEVYLTEFAASPFTAAIAVYPWCGPTRIHKLNAPLLILIGDADDWTPASRCRDMLRQGGLSEASTPHSATLKVYPGAHSRVDGFEPPHRYLSYTVGRHPEAAAHAEADARQFLATHLNREER
jgi:dienelactone hydrolase